MQIVPCRKAHYPDVLDLYGRAWPDDVERKMAAFRWLHDGNPFRDPERSYLLAYQDGVLAGYWGRMPVRFHHRGEPLRCVFHQEALVDPAFRCRGIARRLTREALGTPDLFLSLWHNERILDLHRSHGWADLGLFRPMRKIYRAANLLRWKVANPLVRRLLEPMAKLALALRRRPPPRPAGFAVVLHTFPAFHAGLGRWGFRNTRRPASTSQLLYLDRRGGQGAPPGDSYRGWALTYGDSDGHLW